MAKDPTPIVHHTSDRCHVYRPILFFNICEIDSTKSKSSIAEICLCWAIAVDEHDVHI